MSIFNFIGTIASVISNKKRKKRNKNFITKTHPIHMHTKQQHLNWIKEGKCQCCGSNSGEFAGICDECRLS